MKIITPPKGTFCLTATRVENGFVVWEYNMNSDELKMIGAFNELGMAVNLGDNKSLLKWIEDKIAALPIPEKTL